MSATLSEIRDAGGAVYDAIFRTKGIYLRTEDGVLADPGTPGAFPTRVQVGERSFRVALPRGTQAIDLLESTTSTIVRLPGGARLALLPCGAKVELYALGSC